MYGGSSTLGFALTVYILGTCVGDLIPQFCLLVGNIHGGKLQILIQLTFFIAFNTSMDIGNTELMVNNEYSE